MNKFIFGFLIVCFSSDIFAENKVPHASQLKIIKEQTTGLNKCSGLALINPESLLNSKENQANCEIPYIVFSESNLFSNTVINKNDQLLLKSASAVAKGIIVRNKNDRGIIVDSEDRQIFYNAPYDVITTKQMPKVTCAYLSTLYEKKPQYFEKKPSCMEVISILNK